MLTAHYLEKAGTIVGVRAVAILAGLPEDFKQQCHIGRAQVLVPDAWVDKLLPGIFTLQRELRAQVHQASSKRDVDYSSLALADTLIMLAQAVFQCLPFRINTYGTSYALLQLPAVRQIVMSPQWPQFSTGIFSSHAHMEQQRQAPWQKMIPGLAGTLSQLQGNVQRLTAAFQQQTAAQAQQAAEQAAGQAAQEQQAAAQAADRVPQAAGQAQQAGQAAPQAQAQHAAAPSGHLQGHEGSPRAGCGPAATPPAGGSSQQQVTLPEERPQVAARLLCSRVRSVKEAYEVRCSHVWLWLWLQLLKAGAGRSLLMVCCSSRLGDARSLCAAACPTGVVRGPLALRSGGAGHRSIRKQPQLVLGHVNSQAISKCRALPELVRTTVPLAGSEAEAIRRVTLVQQELKLTLSEMREACRALKAAADSGLGIPAGKLVPSTERKKQVPLAAVRAALLRACVAVW